jgi:shikimate dehydrogenase
MKDLRSINFNTRVCAVIGNPVAHSLSPAIHNAGYEALDLDFLYLPCQVEDVASALAGMRAFHNFRGMSVTIPHKIEVMKYVDEISEADRTIGSINTIVKEGNKLVGLGTDGPGALKALIDAGVAMEGRTVLMLGAGGSARAIAFTLALQTDLGELEILARSETMLQGLTSDLKNHTEARISSSLMTDISLACAMEKADIIIHCTPLGMHPRVDASLVPAKLFRPEQVVFDIVYTPLETRLLADARARGLQVISGVEMFINQAVLQFERFTGTDAPEDVMRRVVMEHLQS